MHRSGSCGEGETSPTEQVSEVHHSRNIKKAAPAASTAIAIEP
jgi:hypothetical protein